MVRILVVDDEPSVRALVRDILEMEDYQVEEAPDGRAALAKVAARTPDLIVLDVMMPGLSGLDVLRLLRGEYSSSDLPILLLTAAADDDTTWAGWTSGASVFLPKPFDPGTLLDWVERLLAGRVGPTGSAKPGGRKPSAQPVTNATTGGSEDLWREFRGLGET